MTLIFFNLKLQQKEIIMEATYADNKMITTENSRVTYSTKDNNALSENNKHFNNLLKVAFTGQVHIFDETMTKEVIHKKMDDLFGW